MNNKVQKFNSFHDPTMFAPRLCGGTGTFLMEHMLTFRIHNPPPQRMKERKITMAMVLFRILPEDPHPLLFLKNSQPESIIFAGTDDWFYNYCYEDINNFLSVCNSS